MPSAGYRILGGVVPGGSGVTLLARILGQTGKPVTQASLSTIGYAVTDLIAATQTTGSFSISTTIFDNLVQNDPRWTFDNQYTPGASGLWGYNFAGSLASTSFPLATASAVPLGYPVQPAPPRPYQIDVTWTPVTGAAFKQSFAVTVLPTYG
jgi:hypothetical protein